LITKHCGDERTPLALQGNPGPDLGTLFYAPQNGSRLNYVMNTCSPDQVPLLNAPAMMCVPKCITKGVFPLRVHYTWGGAACALAGHSAAMFQVLSLSSLCDEVKA
jgi:hypothetical protein